jgi:hypothetical protein
MTFDTQVVLKQFDSIEALYNSMNTSIQRGEFGAWYPDEGTPAQFHAVCLSCIDRIAGSDSPYGKLADECLVRHRIDQVTCCQALFGIVQGLKRDVKAGYLTTLRELVHAEVFSDMLEGAEYLLAEGYKDPAAVMVGGVLEEHLRQLCGKNSIPIEIPDSRQPSRMVAIKADSMNAELVRASAYGKLEQKQVTAWLDLRNKAAHALYGQYDASQVALFLQGLRDFIIKYPA